MEKHSLSLGGIAALCIVLAYRWVAQRGQGRRLPGPKPLSLLGNIRDLPPGGTPEYLHWLQHKDLYGGISSVTVMGMTLVIIHDATAAHELLEQRAGKTSGRPDMVMANKLCGYGAIVLCQSYSAVFRRCRKLLHREFGTKVSASQFCNDQEEAVKRQLVRVLNDPTKLLGHFKTTTAGIVLKMTYDYTIESNKPDLLVDMIDKMMTEFSLAATPMAWAVDLIPLLQYLPENFPGATFKRTARQWRKSIRASAYIPYEFVRRKMSAQKENTSYVSRLVRQSVTETGGDLSSDDEEAIIWTAASLYGAAADTTVITLTAFTLAMIRFPEVQKKAQDEIDRVIGTHRLPCCDDRARLPYINALVKEATRWWPIAPMGFPHTATENIEYAGFRIPKGAYLLPAVWWFLHNPEVYLDPESFNPDRFLPPRDEPDPAFAAFGYGRRVCPGRFFADNGLYLNIVLLLAAFKIGRAKTEDGREIETDVKPKPGVLAYLTEFSFQVLPRSERYIDLIRQIERLHPSKASSTNLLETNICLD